MSGAGSRASGSSSRVSGSGGASGGASSSASGGDDDLYDLLFSEWDKNVRNEVVIETLHRWCGQDGRIVRGIQGLGYEFETIRMWDFGPDELDGDYVDQVNEMNEYLVQTLATWARNQGLTDARAFRVWNQNNVMRLDDEDKPMWTYYISLGNNRVHHRFWGEIFAEF